MKVECNFVSDRVETCIQAMTEFDIMKMEEFKQDFTQHKWMSTLTETTKIEYPVRGSQWRNLVVGMRSGHQNVTYHCKNSPAHKNMEGSTANALRLLTNKRVELRTDTKSRTESVEVVEDNCWMNDGSWQQTVVDYTTKDLTKLPLRDVAVMGAGNADESFSLTVGRVCFST